jgi:hypothetical protein
MCITPSSHNITNVVLTSIQSYYQYILETAQFINELTASVISICWPFIACPPPVWMKVCIPGSHAVCLCMHVWYLSFLSFEWMKCCIKILYECYTIGCHPNSAVYDFMWMVITPWKISEFAIWVRCCGNSMWVHEVMCGDRSMKSK